MISKAFGLLKKITKAFSFDIERLMKLNHARNVEFMVNYLLELKKKKPYNMLI